MADLNVGGVRATLGIDASGWTAGLNESMRSLSYWEKSVGNTLNKVNRMVGERMKAVGQSMSAFGVGLGASLAGAMKVYADFDKASRQVNSIMRLSEKEADAYRLQIRKLTMDLGLNVDQTQVMSAAYSVASSGFVDAAEQAQVLTAGLRLAAAGGGDAKQTLDALTGALRAYGKGAADAADFADVLAKTVEVGQTEISQLAPTLSRVTTTAANAGVSFAEVGAAIAAMTVKGAPTANVMDALNQAMLQIQAPSAEARKALASVGLQAEELGKTLRDQGLRAALVQIFNATGGNVAKLKAIMGDVNAVKAVQALGSGGGADFAAAQGQMDNRAGTAEQQAAEVTKALTEQLGIALTSIKELGIAMGQGLAPTIERVTSLLREMASYLTAAPEPVKQLAGQFAGLAAVGTVVTGVLLQMAPGILSVTAFLSTGGLTAALVAAKGALASFATAAGPIVAVLAAVAASVALLSTAWTQNWFDIQGSTKEALNQVRAMGVELITWFRAELEPSIRELQAVWQEVWAIIGPTVMDVLAAMVPAVAVALRTMIQSATFLLRVLLETFKLALAGIKTTVSFGMEFVGSSVKNGLDLVVAIGKTAMAVFTGNWREAWNGLLDIIRAAGTLIYDATIGAIGNAIKALGEFVGAFFDAGKRLMTAFGDGLSSGVDYAVSTVGGLLRQRQDEQRAASVQRAQAAYPAPTGNVGLMWADFSRTMLEDWNKTWQQAKNGSAAGSSPAKKSPAPAPPPVPAPAATAPSTTSTRAASPARVLTEAERIVAEVNRRVGGVFQPGDPEQCANFVRDVYRRAGVKLGVTRSPLDKGPTGSALASSFAGTDVGQVIRDRRQLKAGDIVTYANTYGNFEPGAITHAGIYSGRGQIVHRPTASGRVVRAGLDDPGKFAYGIRPYAIGGDREAVAKMEQAKKEAEKLGSSIGASIGDQIEKQLAALREMADQRIELMSDETEKERAQLRQRFDAMVEHWQKVARETPGLAAQAEEQIALIRQAQAEQTDALEEKLWEKRYQKAMEAKEWSIQMGQEQKEALSAFLEEQLINWEGTEEGKQQAMARYRDAFLSDLVARREAQDGWNVADLEAELEHLQAKTELTVAEEIRKKALLDEVESARQAKLKETEAIGVGIAESLENSFQQAFVGVLSGQQSFADGFKSIWNAVKQAFLQALAEMIVKTQAFQAMLMALKTAMNALGGWIGGLFGFHQGGVVPQAHTGGTVIPGGIRSYHSGGTAGGPRLRSDEVLAKLQTGEIVLSRQTVQNLGRTAGAADGPGVNLTIQNLHNHGPQDVATMARDLGRRTAWYLQGA